MKIYIKGLLFLTLLAALLLPARVTLADTAPKPTMDFEFQQEIPGERLAIVSGTLYECDAADCSDAKPLREMGPQRFTCEEYSCHAMAYGFSAYQRLEILFSDGKTRQSNVFSYSFAAGTYQVAVRQTDLVVTPQIGPFLTLLSSGAVCCLCGLLLGATIMVLGGLLVARRLRKK